MEIAHKSQESFPNAMIRQSRHSGGSYGRSNLTAQNAARRAYVTCYAAAAFAPAGTEATVFRICEAIW
jgi:hypothetical protein